MQSPDGRWVATRAGGSCAIGTRTGAGIMVDLALASDASHAKRVFNMRVPRTRDLWPRVIWKSPTTMELWAPNRAEIMAQESQFDGVQIQLKYCGDNPAERAQVRRVSGRIEAVDEGHHRAWAMKQEGGSGVQ